MDHYTLTKYVHILAAVLWVGGGFAVVLLGFLAERAKSQDDLLAIINAITKIAPRVFVPGTVIVLLTGLVMVFAGGFSWDAWIMFGIIGIIITGVIGSQILSPLAEKSMKALADGRKDEAVALGQRLIHAAKSDYVLQFVIVYAMVAKPSWSDTGILITMLAVVVVLGGLLHMRKAAPLTT
jgi:uncharacterized membrane protein